MHSGVWVAGTQKDKDTTCTVTLHGMVRPFEKYELLENVDAAARISWLQWDKYTQLHLGTVYVEKNELIARYVVPKTDKEPRYSHYIGTLTMTENYPNNIVYVTEVRILASMLVDLTICHSRSCVFIETIVIH